MKECFQEGAYDKALVAFLDFMGYKVLTYEEKRKLHELLCKFSKQINQQNRESYNKKIENFIFSDNIFLFIGIPSDIKCFCNCDNSKNCNEFIRFLEVIDFLYTKSLKNGFFLRGAVSIGEIIYNQVSVGGKGVIDTYIKESKEAFYPLIVIDGKFLKTCCIQKLKKRLIKINNSFYLNPFSMGIKTEECKSILKFLNIKMKNTSNMLKDRFKILYNIIKKECIK